MNKRMHELAECIKVSMASSPPLEGDELRKYIEVSNKLVMALDAIETSERVVTVTNSRE